MKIGTPFASCAVLGMLAASLSAPMAVGTESTLDRALDWLRGQQEPNGCIAYDSRCALDGSAWAAIAFRAAGIDPATVQFNATSPNLVDYLKDNVDALGDRATSWERAILAAVASEGPSAAYDFGGVDLVEQLLVFYDGQQLGDPATLTEEYFGLLALQAAGFSAESPVVTSLRDLVLRSQQPNGGWSWGTITPDNEGAAFALGADVDDTAAAINALEVTALDAVGEAVDDVATLRAFGYMRQMQFVGGGHIASYSDIAFSTAFGGLTANSDSTSWAIMAMNSAGMDPTGPLWTLPDGSNPVTFLASLQQADGSFVWKPADALGTPALPSFVPVSTTAWAALALTGEDFVVLPG